MAATQRQLPHCCYNLLLSDAACPPLPLNTSRRHGRAGALEEEEEEGEEEDEEEEEEEEGEEEEEEQQHQHLLAW
jgi:hypothetical protein